MHSKFVRPIKRSLHTAGQLIKYIVLLSLKIIYTIGTVTIAAFNFTFSTLGKFTQKFSILFSMSEPNFLSLTQN